MPDSFKDKMNKAREHLARSDAFAEAAQEMHCLAQMEQVLAQQLISEVKSQMGES